MCQEDLNAMNKHIKKSKDSFMLRCDARSATSPDQPSASSRCKQKKASENPPPSKWQQIEEEMDSILKDLQSKHGDNYTKPQLRCWARMIIVQKSMKTQTLFLLSLSWIISPRRQSVLPLLMPFKVLQWPLQMLSHKTVPDPEVNYVILSHLLFPQLILHLQQSLASVLELDKLC